MSRREWLRSFKGMPNSKKYWKIFGHTDVLAQVELYYVYWLNDKEDQCFIELMEDFVTRSREVRFKMKDQPKDCVAKDFLDTYKLKLVSLGNCTTAATPCVAELPYGYFLGEEVLQQKGNNPMRVEYNTPTASASVINSKSDEAYQREYLLTELDIITRCTWRDAKYAELNKLFRISTPSNPTSSKALLDAIQNGKFTVDEKKLARAEKFDSDPDDFDFDEDDGTGLGNLFYGITFTDYPKPDRKGYDLAVKEYEKAKDNTKRKIIVGTPAEGLDALLALEAWLPTGKAN